MGKIISTIVPIVSTTVYSIKLRNNFAIRIGIVVGNFVQIVRFVNVGNSKIEERTNRCATQTRSFCWEIHGNTAVTLYVRSVIKYTPIKTVVMSMHDCYTIRFVNKFGYLNMPMVFNRLTEINHSTHYRVIHYENKG